MRSCEIFCGKAVPEGKPPLVSLRDDVAKMHTALWWYVVGKMVQMVGGWAGAVEVGVGAVCWCWFRM